MALPEGQRRTGHGPASIVWLGDLGQVSSLLLFTKEETRRNFPKQPNVACSPQAPPARYAARAESPARVTLIEQDSNGLEGESWMAQPHCPPTPQAGGLHLTLRKAACNSQLAGLRGGGPSADSGAVGNPLGEDHTKFF